MKRVFRTIHLYLGLAAGLIVMTCCLTGTILVFEEELQHAFNRDRYEVNQGSSRVSLQQLASNLEAKEQKAKVTRIQVFDDPKRSVIISFTGGKKSQAYMNPYTGEVIELYKYQDTFFYDVFALHRWLLSGDIGKLIVGISTLIFVFILITGIILWWPATRRILVSRLKVKLDGGWKRKNHDFHIVLGFYSAIFLFVFAFTGLAWSFEWFNKGIYKVTNSPLKAPPPPKSLFQAGLKMVTYDEAIATAQKEFKAVEYYSINLPKDSSEAIAISALSKNAIHESASDAIYLDQYWKKNWAAIL